MYVKRDNPQIKMSLSLNFPFIVRHKKQKIVYFQYSGKNKLVAKDTEKQIKSVLPLARLIPRKSPICDPQAGIFRGAKLNPSAGFNT